jgi:hypothetical protein
MDHSTLTGSTRASLSFYSKDDHYKSEKPYCFTGEFEAFPRTNQAFEDHEVLFHDLRTAGKQFTLADHGVEYLQHTPETNLTSITDNTIAPYLREMTTFVKEQFKAEYCFCYSYKVGHSSTSTLV